MKAVMYEEFRGPLIVKRVADPNPGHHGVVVKVEASGICRSDWHGWLGHDPDIRHLPHVPGHELAGTVEVAGSKVNSWEKGDRVTVPFVMRAVPAPSAIRATTRSATVRASQGSRIGVHSPSTSRSSTQTSISSDFRTTWSSWSQQALDADSPPRSEPSSTRAGRHPASGWLCTAAAASGCRQS